MHTRTLPAFSHAHRDARHDAQTLRNFQSVMRPFVLRRLKSDVLKQMVPKREVVIKVNMEEEQRAIYNGILTRWKQSQVAKAKQVRGSSSAPQLLVLCNVKGQGAWEDGLLERVAGSDITSIFTQLRKAANHRCKQTNTKQTNTTRNPQTLNSYSQLAGAHALLGRDHQGVTRCSPAAQLHEPLHTLVCVSVCVCLCVCVMQSHHSHAPLTPRCKKIAPVASNSGYFGNHCR